MGPEWTWTPTGTVSFAGIEGEWVGIGHTTEPVAMSYEPLALSYGPGCASCGGPLRPDGPDATFCDEVCQRAWYARGTGQLPGLDSIDLAAEIDFTAVAAGLDALGRQLGELARSVGEFLNTAFAELAAGLDHAAAERTLHGPRWRGQQVGLVLIDEMTGPSAVRERALWLRRQRNTGPPRIARPARSVGQPATLGCHGSRAARRSASGRPRKK